MRFLSFNIGRMVAGTEYRSAKILITKGCYLTASPKERRIVASGEPIGW